MNNDLLTNKSLFDKIYTLSRVDERIGSLTPQQPVLIQGANTGKA